MKRQPFTRAVAIAVAVASLSLAACATTGEPSVRVIEKAVPTPVPCVSEATPRPRDYPDSDEALKAAPSAAARYALIAAGRLLRIQRLAEVEPVVEACRAPPARASPPT
jgi:hypothetical protein